jgi:arsenite methyltransferase
MKRKTEQDSVRDKVRAGYAKIAKEGSWRRQQKAAQTGCCCGSGLDAEGLAARIGYRDSELASLPDGANMGVSCGNPTAIASLQPGEVVLDLGSGAGFDAFLAGPRVGGAGRVIGVDMTPEMLAKARRNADTYRDRTGFDNVEFRLGEIEHLPVGDASVDVVISNCVLNLSPDKPQVWREVARVLKPGGRVAVSDLALLRPLPDAVKQMAEALVGCVAGALLIGEYRRIVCEAGLTDVVIEPKADYVRAMMEHGDPLYIRIAEHLRSGERPDDYITSVSVTARKPDEIPAALPRQACQ